MRYPSLLLAAPLALCSVAASAQDPALPKQVRIVVASIGGTGPDFKTRRIMQDSGMQQH